ncbi:MAG: cupredoxin domain-containing protein [Rhizomicrobium sp.]
MPHGQATAAATHSAGTAAKTAIWARVMTVLAERAGLRGRKTVCGVEGEQVRRCGRCRTDILVGRRTGRRANIPLPHRRCLSDDLFLGLPGAAERQSYTARNRRATTLARWRIVIGGISPGHQSAVVPVLRRGCALYLRMICRYIDASLWDSIALQLKHVIFAAVLAALATPALADGPIPVTLKDHKFTPATIRVKAGVSNVIALTNNDDAAEEFDSTSLKVRRSLPGTAPAMCACVRWRRAAIRSWANTIPKRRRAS